MKIRGFTLIEMVVVVVMIAILAAVSVPMVSRAIVQSREAALRQNLAEIRKAIDDFYADTGKYPSSLDLLVQRRYLRSIPRDPLNESNPWKLVYTADGEGVVDLLSQAPGSAADGTAYSEW